MSFPFISCILQYELRWVCVTNCIHSISQQICHTQHTFLGFQKFPLYIVHLYYKGFPMQLLKQILTCFQLQCSCYKVPGHWFSALHLEPLDARHQNGTMATFNQEVFIQTTPRKNGHKKKKTLGACENCMKLQALPRASELVEQSRGINGSTKYTKRYLSIDDVIVFWHANILHL